MASIDCSINGTHFSTTPGQYIQAVMRFTTPEYRETVFSTMTAHAPDRVDTLYSLTGYEEDPMNLQAESSWLGESPRGTHTSYAIQPGGSAKELLFHKIREPLFISPLLQMAGHGMTNINEIQVTINWAPSLAARMVSYLPCVNKGVSLAGGGGPAANCDPADLRMYIPQTGTQGGPVLIVRYYTPSDDLRIPAEITLPFTQPYPINKNLVNIAPNTDHVAYGDNIRLNQIPSCVYLFVSRSEGARNDLNMMAYSDSFLQLNKVNIQWGNMSGVLSGLNQSQLIDLSRENGLDLRSMQSAFEGSIVYKLVFGKDIPLSEMQSPGVRGDFSFQCTLNYKTSGSAAPKNKSNTDITLPNDYTFHQLFMLSGKVDIRPQECSVETGIVSVGDLQNAEDMGSTFTELGAEGGSLVGGSHVGGSYVGGSVVGGGFETFAKDLLPIAMKHAKPLAEAIAPTVKDLVDAYKSRN
jgi:hypothetical protein